MKLFPPFGKLLVITTAFLLLGALFVSAPPLYLHANNGTDWVPVLVDDYGRPLIEASCVKEYVEFEFTDNAAPPIGTAYYTLEGSVDMNANHGVRAMWDFNMTEVHINSRTSATCSTALNAVIMHNGAPLTNIRLRTGYSNSTTDRLPVTISKHDVLSLKANLTHSCLTFPDDVIIRVSGVSTCD